MIGHYRVRQCGKKKTALWYEKSGSLGACFYYFYDKIYHIVSQLGITAVGRNRKSKEKGQDALCSAC